MEMMVSQFETTLPHQESSRIHDGEEEEQLVDYEPSPILEVTHIEVISNVNDDNEDDAISKSVELVDNIPVVVEKIDGVEAITSTKVVVDADPTPIDVDVAIFDEQIVEEIFYAIFEMITKRVYAEDLESPVVVGLEAVGGNAEVPTRPSKKVYAHDGLEKETTIEKEAIEKEFEFPSTPVAYEKGFQKGIDIGQGSQANGSDWSEEILAVGRPTDSIY